MLVFIRGAGDLATGISIRLYRAGISVCHSDLAIPTAVRRNVAFSEAIRLGECSVEGITAVRAESLEEIHEAISQKKVPVVVDEGKSFLHRLQPDAVVDAILAKRNLGTCMEDARLVNGKGPGFTAAVDCHAVVESKRGHDPSHRYFGGGRRYLRCSKRYSYADGNLRNYSRNVAGGHFRISRHEGRGCGSQRCRGGVSQCFRQGQSYRRRRTGGSTAFSALGAL